MKISYLFFLLLLGAFSITDLFHAQDKDQQGFISLDCGLPVNEVSPYIEPSTGQMFSSDANFIRTGKAGKIMTHLESEHVKPYTTLRYFPDGIHNCYSLSVEKGRKHLIRAVFVYGNYDGLNTNPRFDLHLGSNLWETIDLEKFVNGTITEIHHIPASSSLHVCLIKTGTTAPMISSLEVRPLEHDSYPTKSGSLKHLARAYLNDSGSELRYPDDVYDRWWAPIFSSRWIEIPTTLDVSNDNSYDPPKVTLATAGIPVNASAPLTITWNQRYPGEQFYFYSHFAELQDLPSNETREFDMLWNGVVIAEAIVPSKLKISTVPSLSPRTCEQGECKFQLIRTQRSTQPPLLNAIEIYAVIQFPLSETNEDDVSAIKSIEATYGLNKINWQGDPCVPQQYAWNGLNCTNSDKSTPPRITLLNLSSSGLTGTIAAGIKNLTVLQKLNFSNNNLTGGVPEFLVEMKSLSFIDLSGNDLSGSIPRALQRKGLELFVQGNPRLCISGPCTKAPKKFPVAIGVPVSVVAFFVVLCLIYFLIRKKEASDADAETLQHTATASMPTSRYLVPGPQQTMPIQQNTPVTNYIPAASPEPSIEAKKRKFTYSDVKKMTNSFERLLGDGGFGFVYHGTLYGSEEVAVRVLSESSAQGYHQFREEVNILMEVEHTNLVRLVGFCDKRDHLALIYEFMPNDNLRWHLSGKQGRSIIDWSTRLQIALGAAMGLEHLHSIRMVHRDVKITNILLDEELKAKLADFGLSRSSPVGSESRISSQHARTPLYLYLDPEYLKTNKLTEKSDVYSFGIVLLEIITNKLLIDQNREIPHITEWVGYELNRENIHKIMDPNLPGNYNSRSAWMTFELALACANPSSSERPNMSIVVKTLKQCIGFQNSTNKSGCLDSQSFDKPGTSFDAEKYHMAR